MRYKLEIFIEQNIFYRLSINFGMNFSSFYSLGSKGNIGIPLKLKFPEEIEKLYH